MSTLAQRMTALEASVATIAAAVVPARSRAKSAKANTFVTDVIRSVGADCPQCGKHFRTATRAIPANHWHAAEK